MTLEEAQLIDKYERLFAEEGWKELVEDFKERRRTTAERLLSGSDTFDRIQFARGQNSVWTYIVELEAIVESAKQNQLPGAEDLPDVP